MDGSPSSSVRIGSRIRSAIRAFDSPGGASEVGSEIGKPPNSPSALSDAQDSGIAGHDAAVLKLTQFSQDELRYVLSTQRRGFEDIFTTLQKEVVSTLKSRAVASVNPRSNPRDTIKQLVEIVSDFVAEAASRLEEVCVNSWEVAIRDYLDRLGSTGARLLTSWSTQMREEIARKAGYSASQADKKIELARTASQREFEAKWDARVKPVLAAAKMKEAVLQTRVAELKEEIDTLNLRCATSESIIRGFKEAADARVRDTEDECERLRTKVASMRIFFSSKIAQKDAEVKAAKEEMLAAQRRRGILPDGESGTETASVGMAAASKIPDTLSQSALLPTTAGPEETASVEVARLLSERRATDSLADLPLGVRCQPLLTIAAGEMQDDVSETPTKRLVQGEDVENSASFQDTWENTQEPTETDKKTIDTEIADQSANAIKLSDLSEHLTEVNSRIAERLEVARQEGGRLDELRRSVEAAQQDQHAAATQIQAAHRRKVAQRQFLSQQKQVALTIGQDNIESEQSADGGGWVAYAALLDDAKIDSDSDQSALSPGDLPLGAAATSEVAPLHISENCADQVAASVATTSNVSQQTTQAHSRKTRPSSATTKAAATATTKSTAKPLRRRPQSAPVHRRTATRLQRSTMRRHGARKQELAPPPPLHPGATAPHGFTTKLPMRSAQTFGPRKARSGPLSVAGTTNVTSPAVGSFHKHNLGSRYMENDKAETTLSVLNLSTIPPGRCSHQAEGGGASHNLLYDSETTADLLVSSWASLSGDITSATGPIGPASHQYVARQQWATRNQRRNARSRAKGNAG